MKRTVLTAGIVVAAMTAALGFSQVKRAGKPGPDSVESLLVAREKQKWEQFAHAGSAVVTDEFADDFISIGYSPEGGVSRATKPQILSGEFKVPPSAFDLSDFKVITSNGDTAVVTYRARRTTPPGPDFNIYATSVWVKRGGVWKTVFYQATRIP